MKSDEDEAFEQIEQAQGWRKRQIANALDKKAENARELGLTYDDDTMCYRGEVIEEVARAIERFRGAFGDDTVDSFAIFIRSLK